MEIIREETRRQGTWHDEAYRVDPWKLARSLAVRFFLFILDLPTYILHRRTELCRSTCKVDLDLDLDLARGLLDSTLSLFSSNIISIESTGTLKAMTSIIRLKMIFTGIKRYRRPTCRWYGVVPCQKPANARGTQLAAALTRR